MDYTKDGLRPTKDLADLVHTCRWRQYLRDKKHKNRLGAGRRDSHMTPTEDEGRSDSRALDAVAHTRHQHWLTLIPQRSYHPLLYTHRVILSLLQPWNVCMCVSVTVWVSGKAVIPRLLVTGLVAISGGTLYTRSGHRWSARDAVVRHPGGQKYSRHYRGRHGTYTSKIHPQGLPAWSSGAELVTQRWLDGWVSWSLQTLLWWQLRLVWLCKRQW